MIDPTPCCSCLDPQADGTPDVLSALDTFISRAPARMWHGRPVSRKTLQHYAHLRRYLADYVAATGVELRFGALDAAFCHSYIAFAYSRGLRLNTIGNHLKNLKVLVRSQPPAVRPLADGLMHSAIPREESDNIALTEAEIALIARTPVPSERLRTVRDMFVLMCWTGVRHSDLPSLDARSIHCDPSGCRYFRFAARKTGRLSMVKILPEAQQVLDRYGDGHEMPRIIANQKFNTALRRVMEIVHRTWPSSSLEAYFSRSFTAWTDGAIRRNVAVSRRWQLVRCHTARRSFATNMRLRGNDCDVICAATGHASVASLSRYIKDSLMQRAARLH